MTTQPHPTLPPSMAFMARLGSRLNDLTPPATMREPEAERPEFVPHEQFLTLDGKVHNPIPLMLLPDGNGHDVLAYRHSIYLMRYPATYTDEELSLIEEFVARQDAHWRIHSPLALPLEGFARPVARIGRMPRRNRASSPTPATWMVYREDAPLTSKKAEQRLFATTAPTLGHLLSQMDAPLATRQWWFFTSDGEPTSFSTVKRMPNLGKLPALELIAPSKEILLRYLALVL